MIKTQKKFIEWIANELNIKKLSDLASITLKQHCTYGGWSLLQKYSGIYVPFTLTNRPTHSLTSKRLS